MQATPCGPPHSYTSKPALDLPSTEPALQAQSHCCAPAQQSHLSYRSNLTAAQPQSHFARNWGRNKKISYPRANARRI